MNPSCSVCFQSPRVSSFVLELSRRAGRCLRDICSLGCGGLCECVQARVNLRALFPNVLSMSNGPKEQNHRDSNVGGQERWEFHQVSKFPGGENPLSLSQNTAVLGSTTLWGRLSKQTAFVWKHTVTSGLGVPGKSSFPDEVSPMKEHAFTTESAFS